MTEVRTEAQVFSIWESRFPPEDVRRGQDVTNPSGRRCRAIPATSVTY
jgi:hypothetical protein